jgi:hypothetical protein
MPRRHPPLETNPADPVGPLMFRRLPSMRDAAYDPDEATPSRIATAHMLPSCTGTHSAFAIFSLSRLNPAPHMAPVYTSDAASPRRPQDSVPTCPLRLWPDETFTHKHPSAFMTYSRLPSKIRRRVLRSRDRHRHRALLYSKEGEARAAAPRRFTFESDHMPAGIRRDRTCLLTAR